MNDNTHTHTYNEYLLVAEQKEKNKKHHLTRFIVYLIIFLFLGLLVLFSGAVGLLIGALFGPEGAVILGFVFSSLAVIVAIISPFLAIYHFIKWINA